ncbi:hypothetical protein [Massilia sp. erpn]|uniref:hypothetical protein n=1 Tax=Massilia sp. erpn TaxID=2738142 RepID=UPI002107ABE7|nr:hypothetical protein [Massilia sp. erpn]UTY59698.1 hypothetical protein HPQ68_22475 [Massilia sp. erpn]
MEHKLNQVVSSSSASASQLTSSTHSTASPDTTHSAPAAPSPDVDANHRDREPIHDTIDAAKQYVKDQYKDMISYHGTSKAGKRSMQLIGMKVGAKTAGATAAMKEEYDREGEVLSEQFIERAGNANYVTRKKEVAMAYGVTNRPPEDAAVARVLAPDWKELGLGRDEDSGASDAAAKTEKDIGPGFILQSKQNGDRSLTIGAYKQIHAELTKKFPLSAQFITLDDIADLIHEVQTDSEGEEERKDWAKAKPRC